MKTVKFASSPRVILRVRFHSPRFLRTSRNCSVPPSGSLRRTQSRRKGSRRRHEGVGVSPDRLSPIGDRRHIGGVNLALRHRGQNLEFGAQLGRQRLPLCVLHGQLEFTCWRRSSARRAGGWFRSLLRRLTFWLLHGCWRADRGDGPASWCGRRTRASQ